MNCCGAKIPTPKRLVRASSFSFYASSPPVLEASGSVILMAAGMVLVLLVYLQLPDLHYDLANPTNSSICRITWITYTLQPVLGGWAPILSALSLRNLKSQQKRFNTELPNWVLEHAGCSSIKKTSWEDDHVRCLVTLMLVSKYQMQNKKTWLLQLQNAKEVSINMFSELWLSAAFWPTTGPTVFKGTSWRCIYQSIYLSIYLSI